MVLYLLASGSTMAEKAKCGATNNGFTFHGSIFLEICRMNIHFSKPYLSRKP